MANGEENSMYGRLGGEAGLRAIIADFVDRLFDDIMIGFFFRNASRPRIKEFEFQHAAEYLGANVTYAGRPLHAAHAAHRIMGGQFARRKELLRKTLVDHRVPGDIADAWLAHVESLRPLITADSAGHCND